MLVFSAEGGSYKLEIPDKSAFVFPSIPHPNPDYNFGLGQSTLDTSFSGKIDSSGAPVVTSIQGKWSGKNYFYQGYLDLDSRVECNLAATRYPNTLSDMRGSFTLDLPFDLHDCRLYTPEKEIGVGDLRGKGDYSLPTPASNLQMTLPASDYLVQYSSDLAELQRQAAKSGLLYRDEMLLVGFSDQLPALAELSTKYKKYALSLVVVHLPFEAEVATDGKAQVTRTLLAGGSAFEMRSPYYGGYMVNEDQMQYGLQKDSYVTFSYEIAGEVTSRTNLLVHLNTYNANSYEAEVAVEDFIAVDAWTPSGWRPVRVPPNDRSVYIPVSGIMDESRRVTLRFRALKEQSFEKPYADVS
jgi:hypothetical protein